MSLNDFLPTAITDASMAWLGLRHTELAMSALLPYAIGMGALLFLVCFLGTICFLGLLTVRIWDMIDSDQCS